MESSQDIELINQAIQSLIEEKRIKDASADKMSEDDDDDDEQLLLSRLLSQLESLKGGEGSTLLNEVTSPSVDKAKAKNENGGRVRSRCVQNGVEEIVKELKAVKKQNTVTHCLLSVMIVVTVIWQLSEVSLVLKVKNGLNHPFRSFGSMLVGLLPRPKAGGINNIHDADNHANDHDHHLSEPSIPTVIIPELPHVEFPHIGSSSSSEEH